MEVPGSPVVRGGADVVVTSRSFPAGAEARVESPGRRASRAAVGGVAQATRRRHAIDTMSAGSTTSRVTPFGRVAAAQSRARRPAGAWRRADGGLTGVDPTSPVSRGVRPRAHPAGPPDAGARGHTSASPTTSSPSGRPSRRSEADPASDPPFWAAAWPGRAGAGAVRARPSRGGRRAHRPRPGRGQRPGRGRRRCWPGRGRWSPARSTRSGRRRSRSMRELNGVGPGRRSPATCWTGSRTPTSTSSWPVTSATTGEMTERVLPFLGRAWLGGAAVLLGDPGRPYVPTERLAAGGDLRRPRHRGAPGAPDDGVAAALSRP